MSSKSDMNYVSLPVLEEMVMVVLAFSGCGPSEAWKWIDKEGHGGWQGGVDCTRNTTLCGGWH